MDKEKFANHIDNFIKGERPKPTLSNVDIFTKLTDDQFMVITPVSACADQPIPAGYHCSNMIITSFQQVGHQLMAYKLLSESIKVDHQDVLCELLPALSEDILTPVKGRDPQFTNRVINTGTPRIGKSATLFVVALLLTVISTKTKVNIPIVLRDLHNHYHYFSGACSDFPLYFYSYGFTGAFKNPYIRSVMKFQTPNAVLIFDTGNHNDIKKNLLPRLPLCSALYSTSVKYTKFLDHLKSADSPFPTELFYVPSFPPVNDCVMRNLLPWIKSGGFSNYTDSSKSITDTYLERLSYHDLNMGYLSMNNSFYNHIDNHPLQRTINHILTGFVYISPSTLSHIVKIVHNCETSSQLLDSLALGAESTFPPSVLNDYVMNLLVSGFSEYRKSSHTLYLASILPHQNLGVLYKGVFFHRLVKNQKVTLTLKTNKSRELSWNDEEVKVQQYSDQTDNSTDKLTGLANVIKTNGFESCLYRFGDNFPTMDGLLVLNQKKGVDIVVFQTTLNSEKDLPLIKDDIKPFLMELGLKSDTDDWDSQSKRKTSTESKITFTYCMVTPNQLYGDKVPCVLFSNPFIGTE